MKYEFAIREINGIIQIDCSRVQLYSGTFEFRGRSKAVRTLSADGEAATFIFIGRRRNGQPPFVVDLDGHGDDRTGGAELGLVRLCSVLRRSNLRLGLPTE